MSRQVFIKDLPPGGGDQVCVAGVVVDVCLPRQTHHPTIVGLDDGTGVVDCVSFTSGAASSDPPSVGQCLQVSGRTNVYRDQLQIVASVVKLVEDPNLEIVWVNKTIWHYKTRPRTREK